jgi:replication factor C subunit 1
MLQQTKPVVLSGQFKSNIRALLNAKGFTLQPLLSKRSQLLVPSNSHHSQLIQEAVKKGIPVFIENDVVSQIGAAPQETLLWVDKYKPTATSHIIGHKEQIKELTEWLRCWPQKGAAVLISGPPGIGKTTTAHLIVKECGYFCKEYNASDNRSASSVNAMFATDTYRMRREVVVMDEVDGFDRGGVAALAAIIRSGRVSPIICIANDRSAIKLKPLISTCVDIRFSRPMKITIARAIKERIPCTLSEQQLTDICEKSGNDIRAIINSLQSTGASKDAILRQDIFSATQRLFNERPHLSISDAEQLVFVDYGMIPLMIQESYLVTAKSDLEAATKAAELISFGDTIERRVQRDQAWQLLPNYALNAVAVTKTTGGPAPFNMFPQWLGKNSKAGKHKRMLSSIALKTHMSMTDLRQDYWTPINVMASQKAHAPTEFIDLLENVHLTRDEYFDGLVETMFEPAQIPTKEKTAITRQYNKMNTTAKSKKNAISIPNETNVDADENEELVDPESDDELIYYL